ncbi:hypothetical protein [Nonomuraea sp. NPDC002799]
MTVRPLYLVLVALALPATACSTGAQTPASFGRQVSATPSATRGVVSVAEAKNILAEWDKAGKAAERAGGKDWTASEAELSGEISTAQSKVITMLGEPLDAYEKPVVKPKFAIPGKVAGAPWFMAEFARKGRSGYTQAIFKKTPAGWRVVAMSANSAKARPPAIARDKNGLATAVAPDDRQGLIASPRQIAQGHARLQSTFGADRRAAKIFNSGAIARTNAAGRRADRDTVRPAWTMTVRTQAAPEIYALRTAAGGALVWYGIREQQTLLARSGNDIRLNFTTRATAALSHGERFTRKAVHKSIALYFAVVPRSPALVRVPGEWFTSISITGS